MGAYFPAVLWARRHPEAQTEVYYVEMTAGLIYIYAPNHALIDSLLVSLII